jgi:hypothetical protein
MTSLLRCTFDLGADVDALAERLQTLGLASAAVPAAPKVGEMYAAQFGDGLWYRAKVTEKKGAQFAVFYVDYGNVRLSVKTALKCQSETVAAKDLKTLPSALVAAPAKAHEFKLAYLRAPKDAELAEAAKGMLADISMVWKGGVG